MNTDQPSLDLQTLLSAGSCLVDSKPSRPSPHLKDILQSRLVDFHQRLGHSTYTTEYDTLQDVELETAQEALYVVKQVQLLIQDPQVTTLEQSGSSNVVADIPLLGARDEAQIRTLLSIAFRWGTGSILDRLESTWSEKRVSHLQSPSEIIDLTTNLDDSRFLASFLSRLINVLFPSGVQNQLSETQITSIILSRHLTDILRPSISLGWLPRSFAISLTFSVEEYRQVIMRLLAMLPASESIVALGAILSRQPPPPRHVHRTCASLLSKQLLRPEGVRGLCDAIFDQAEGDHPPLDKLEQVSRVLCTVPSTMKPETYFHSIVPRIVSLLSKRSQPSHKRAAAFALSRMLVNDMKYPHHKLLSTIILPMFHQPFLEVTFDPQDNDERSNYIAPSEQSTVVPSLTASESLSTLLVILTNTDPSPLLLSTLFSPILPALYNALSHLDDRKASDPQLKERLRGVLETWGRLVTFEEAVNGLWSILANEGGEWEVDVTGELKRVSQAIAMPSLSLLTPNDFAEDGGMPEDNLDLNLFNIRPDPIHFVRYIKSLGRSDVASEIFVRLLEAYRRAKSDPDGDPMRTLLYLQVIIQMQNQISGGDESLNIFNKPEHILSFVKHVLESVPVVSPDVKPRQDDQTKSGLRMEDLRFITVEDSLSDDDEGEGSNGFSGETPKPDHEMTETSINLLLSILEATSTLPTQALAILNDISISLLRIANEDSHPVQKLAQEARLVITARLASVSGSFRAPAKKAKIEDPQTLYQRALKLLQDPILPVRAHGLLLLRELVSRKNNKDDVVLDQALVPAILSIFLQSIEHDDSYMFLNAVQGLAAMVDTFGRDVLKGLVTVYAQGLDGLGASNMTQREVDTRLRIGEALGQVIRRCGEALPIYVDVLVPPIFNLVRSPQVPTTMRTSSLSLLADCGKTSVLSLLPYLNDLSEAMIDLLQVETVPATPQKRSSERDPDNQAEQTMDSLPTSTNSKFPPLRRAALHFLSFLLRGIAARSLDSASISSAFPMKRAKLTLSYIASTDDDMMVRVMAQETVEQLKDLSQTMIGL